MFIMFFVGPPYAPLAILLEEIDFFCIYIVLLFMEISHPLELSIHPCFILLGGLNSARRTEDRGQTEDGSHCV